MSIGSLSRTETKRQAGFTAGLLVGLWLTFILVGLVPLAAWFWRDHKGVTDYGVFYNASQFGLPTWATWLADIGQLYAQNWWKAAIGLLLIGLTLYFLTNNARRGAQKEDKARVERLSARR